MSVRILQIPDAIADWPAWLERELIGIHLYTLVQELEILSRGEPKTHTLDESLGSAKQEVLEKGLDALTDAQLRTLLRNPQQLTDLQELIFVEGGEYWQSVPRSDSLQRLAIEQRRNLASQISDALKQSRHSTAPPPIVETTYGRSLAVRPAKGPQVQSHNKIYPTLFSRRTAALTAISAFAACLLFAFIPYFHRSDGGQFFANTSVRKSKLNGDNYLILLADTIRSDWNQQPGSPDAIRDQLIAFRNSCDVLLGSDVPQLHPKVATELKTRCQKWQTKFDNVLDQLAAGADSEQIQTEANQIVQQLMDVLTNLESAA